MSNILFAIPLVVIPVPPAPVYPSADWYAQNVNPDEEMIKTYVHESDILDWDAALAVARERDENAAHNLRLSYTAVV